MSLTLYGLEQCGTCKKARAWLQERGIEHRFVDYRAEPLSPEALSGFARQLSWEKLVNRASLTWRNLPESRKSPGSAGEWLALVAEFPALIKRPLVVEGDQVAAGFTEKQFQARFG